jgi:hypothetical protein
LRLTANGLQNQLGFFEAREVLFGFLKLAGMHAAARAPMLYRKAQMEHLVEQNVFHG